MRQPIRARALLAVLIGVVVLAGTARAQDRAAEPTISVMPLPGGLATVRKAANDTGHSDAGQFFVDIIRRSFQTPVAVRNLRRETVIRPVVDHLDIAAKAATRPPVDHIPLPLTAEVWMRSILEPGARKETLAADILRSSSASLMYCGLLALDDATRRWFGAHGDVLADVAAHHAAQFFIAAPGLRIRDDVVQLPGGAAATAAWESAVGKRVSDPAAFVKAIVERNEVALSYFIGSIAQLSAEQARWMLGVDGSEQSRATAIKRMVTVYDRMSAGWDATRSRSGVRRWTRHSSSRISAAGRTARRTCPGQRRSGRRSSRHPSPDAKPPSQSPRSSPARPWSSRGSASRCSSADRR